MNAAMELQQAAGQAVTAKPVAGAGERRQRLAVDFTPAAFSRLQQLQRELGLKSAADVGRVAFELLNWYAEQKREGYKLQLSKDGRSKDVELFFLGL